MPRSARRTFTLLELLVVIAIIAVLATLTLGALQSAKRKALRAQATNELAQLRVALAQYRQDVGRLPRLAAPRSDSAALLADQAPALCAALINSPSRALGGGPSSPYLSPTSIAVGVLEDPSRLAAATMGYDGVTGARRLDAAERDELVRVAFQAAHAPTSAQPLVLLDPWGNPYHYRPWREVRDSWVERLLAEPVARAGFRAPAHGGGAAPIAGPVEDRPHDVHGADMWSNGPNGVNELGAPDSDDIVSWR